MELEYIKNGLTALFKEMLDRLDDFKKATYKTAFEEGYQKYEDMLHKFSEEMDQLQEPEQAEMIEKLSAVIPDHAEHQLKKVFFLSRSCQATEYNMDLAVYIIPILMYTGDRNCERLARRIVDVWNERSIVSLTLQVSTYQEVAAGFTDTYLGIPIRRKKD